MTSSPDRPIPSGGGLFSGSSELVPGQLFGGKYRIDGHLAEGGMALVVRATHCELGSPVAIKIVRPELAQQAEFVSQLLAEARVAASLRSKHVNRVLDVGRTDAGAPFLVLEFLSGSDLSCHLASRGRFSATEAVDCVMQACEALAEAHAIGIVHRDLKPENLFLSEEADGNWVLKVLDFGISKAPPSRATGKAATSDSGVVGTPAYMAPEQIEGSDVVDARSDLWALGVVLYELCTGSLPFHAESIPDIFRRVLHDAPDPIDRAAVMLPEGLVQVIAKCLRKQQSERFQSVTELAHALAPFGSDDSQATRVAKVSAATSARAAIQSAVGNEDASGGTTPLTLAVSITRSSQHDREQLERSRKRRSALALAAAAVAVIVPGGLGYLAWSGQALQTADRQRPVLAAAAQVAPVETLAEAAPRAAETRSLQHDSDVSELALGNGLTAPAASQKLQRVKSASPKAASRQGTAPLSSPAVSTNVVPTPADAWDPKSFGGRR